MTFARRASFALVVSLASLGCIAGCAHTPPPVTTRSARTPTAAQLAAAAQVGVAAEELTELLNKPMFHMKPTEVGRYLAYLHAAEPDLRARVADLGRKNIGQPYELYLLGEFPYETADDQPLFRLEKSDCVVFAEHTYAMALSQSWEEFFWMLQRIRYRDGIIGVTTRNHYTEVDWDRQNAWLVKDISAELAGDRTGTYTMTVDRSRFLKKRYKIDRDIPVETSTESYVPKEVVAEIEPLLQEGDFVNVISGKNGDHWASHVGLVVLGPNGERHFLHSSEPAVREETFGSYMHRVAEREAKNAAAGKADKLLYGFKFLRLNENPDVPPMAPQPRPRPATP
jgi:hypothetical protein